MRNLSLPEKRNIEQLLKYLKERLQSSSKVKAITTDGYETFIDSNVFSNETLETFLFLSLSDFNQVPKFTNYTFSDSMFVEHFSSILVDGATLYCLSSQALIEKGREFSVSDSGVSFEPPSIADMLTTQYEALLTVHWEKLKLIKSKIDELP